MGIKGLIWLILLVTVSLFTVQNLQPMGLVFLGAKSLTLTLPLSIWMLLFAFSGIIVSLFIQALINSIYAKKSTNNNQQKTAYSNFSPNPQVEKVRQQQFEQNFVEPEIKRKENIYSINDQNLNQDFDFLVTDSIKDNQQEIFNNEPIIEENIEEFDFSSTSSNDHDLEINELQDLENNENDTYVSKGRSPALYSYQSKEKTQIRQKIKSKTPEKYIDQNSVSNNEIYDANFRLINPASSPQNNTNQDDDRKNIEDWDF